MDNTTMTAFRENFANNLRYDDNGLIPAIVQDASTKQVLMMAWMDKEAVGRTISSGETWFWSRSRQEYWHKGATSGNTQRVIDIHVDCDEDVLLVLVEPAGPACHTGAVSCFYDASAEFVAKRTRGGNGILEHNGYIWSPFPGVQGVEVEEQEHTMLNELEQIIADRKANPTEGSYTAALLDKGVNKIAQKVGEEATEVVVAALGEGRDEQIGELADLFYHTLVLMAQLEIPLADVEAKLRSRHQK